MALSCSNRKIEQLGNQQLQRHVVSVAVVVCFAVGGVASRIALTNTQAKNIFFTGYTYFLANSVGSLLMGVFAVFSEANKKKLRWTHLGVTVGFCGALTTFSSWVYDVVMACRAADGLVQLICGLTIPFVCFLVGCDSYSLLAECVQRMPEWVDKVICTLVVLAVIVVPPLVIAAGSVPSGDVYTALLGTVGAFVRYVLCALLNPRSQRFKVGTFVCNVLAVVVNGALNVSCKGDWVYCPRIETGLCGALSTVSSWVSDCNTIYRSCSRFWAYSYTFVSVGVCLAIAAVFHAINQDGHFNQCT